MELRTEAISPWEGRLKVSLITCLLAIHQWIENAFGVTMAVIHIDLKEGDG